MTKHGLRIYNNCNQRKSEYYYTLDFGTKVLRCRQKTFNLLQTELNFATSTYKEKALFLSFNFVNNLSVLANLSSFFTPAS